MAIVAAHMDINGVVWNYCNNHGYTIGENYNGAIEEYDGCCRILVTGQHMEKYEFYHLKMVMLRSRVELISVEWDSTELGEFVEYVSRNDRKGNKHGRLPFGFIWKNGEPAEVPDAIEVARRIIALRDAGKKYREIQADPGVRHLDGRVMSQSTIQVILRNRDKYVRSK